jgi:hypothetical protein
VSPAERYLRAARVPESLEPQEHGLWTILRVRAGEQTNPLLAEFVRLQLGGFSSYTLLYRLTPGTLHRPPGDVVMEDSTQELARHMPIWLNARRVLITGLGLGCVVRGLLANPAVDHVDVVELDRWILECGGLKESFRRNPRVSLHRGDALGYRFILLTSGLGLRLARPLRRRLGGRSPHRSRAASGALPRPSSAPQGAWQLPRWLKRLPRTWRRSWEAQREPPSRTARVRGNRTAPRRRGRSAFRNNGAGPSYRHRCAVLRAEAEAPRSTSCSGSERRVRAAEVGARVAQIRKRYPDACARSLFASWDQDWLVSLEEHPRDLDEVEEQRLRRIERQGALMP